MRACASFKTDFVINYLFRKHSLVIIINGQGVKNWYLNLICHGFLFVFKMRKNVLFFFIFLNQSTLKMCRFAPGTITDDDCDIISITLYA